MSLPARRWATWQDLAAIPDDERRHEVIAGEVVPKEAASGKHGKAQLRFGRFLGPYDRRPGGRWPGGWWFATEAEVELETHEIYRPDVAGWLRERLPELPAETPSRIRPDWVCEILSQNRRNDIVKKKRGYHRSGVPHYWMIDPLAGTLTVLRWAADGYVDVLSAERGDRVRAEPFEAVDLQVGLFFGDDDTDE